MCVPVYLVYTPVGLSFSSVGAFATSHGNSTPVKTHADNSSDLFVALIPKVEAAALQVYWPSMTLLPRMVSRASI